MITMDEILKGKKLEDQTDEIKENLEVLLEKINRVRLAYEKPLTVTSGLRSDADQARINPKAPKSNHLKGAAIDILDPFADLYHWAKANESLLVEIGLWMEERRGGWLHFQIFPPKSQRRWFNP